MNQSQIFPEEKFTTHGYSLWLVRSETVQKIFNKFHFHFKAFGMINLCVCTMLVKSLTTTEDQVF